MGAVRKIIHIDMDAFFASVEQRDHPKYRGKAIASGRTHAPQIPDEQIDPNNVMPKMCASCPWRSDANRLEVSPTFWLALTQQVLTEANQRCHAPALSGKAETRICRGARDLQLRVFHALGVLTEPTDDCWKQTLARCRSTFS